MACPGSVTLLKTLDMAASDESDFAAEGTAMHEAAAHCLRTGADAWEVVGEWFGDFLMTPELTDPIQVYLDYVRSLHGTPYIEYGISSPIHELFYGTLDFGAVNPGLIHVVDLKGGQGVRVEIEGNAQVSYYAFGLIDGLERASGKTFPNDLKVDVAIVQPRWFDPNDRIREWFTTVGEIKAWVHGILVPAMLATEYDKRLDAGDHCRFCPAKLVCPLLTSLWQAAATANPEHLVTMDDRAVGRNLRLAEGVKHYVRALEKEAMARMMQGRTLEQEDGKYLKLVRKKSNRVLRDGAADLARAKWGDQALTDPELKSVPQLEKLPGGASWVKEFAYAPDTGLTIAFADDPRAGQKVTSAAETFKAALKTLEAAE